MSSRFYEVNVSRTSPISQEYTGVKLTFFDISLFSEYESQWLDYVKSDPIKETLPFVINNFITTAGYSVFAGGRDSTNTTEYDIIQELFISHGYNLPDNILVRNGSNPSLITFPQTGKTLHLSHFSSSCAIMFADDDFNEIKYLSFNYSYQGTRPKQDSDILNSGSYWNVGDVTSGTMQKNQVTEIKNAVAGSTPNEVTPTDTDPYGQGGNSDTGGGTGNFDGTGDNVDFPSLPTLSAVDTGFITLFNPSESQLKSLANYMWGDLFDLNTWKKIFADPMDAILGMSIVPVAVPDGGLADVIVGNISTGISMNRAARQYVEVDCGTLNVNEYWGAYLDYDPYTKAEIYLPYVGTHPLATDDIMNKSVHVKYHVDILSGACCAYVKCGGSVMYSFVGQCSCSIPITGNDWSNVVNGALSIAASIGTMVATGGASAPMAAATIASTAVNSMKPSVEKSGSMGGMGGMLGVQTPYLILTRPRQALPKYQNKFMGYPSFITMKLSDCSGYTEIESVHLENLSATEQELSEIESLLKGGVIL